MLTIDQMIAAIWRRRLSVVVTFVLALATVAAVTFSLPKVYRTTAYALVSSSGSASNDYEATQTNQVLMKTYAELLQTRGVAERVAGQLPFAMGPSTVQADVRIAPVSQSQLIAITAEGTSPGRAQTLADTYAEVFLERAAALSRQNSVTSRITLAESAPLEEAPVRPRPSLYLPIGAVLAAFLAVATALVRQRFDQRLEIEPSTTEIFDLPIIGRIPQLAASRHRTRSNRGEPEPSEELAEAFRLLLSNLVFANGGELPKSVAVVSSQEAEGKSTCCIGMGRAAAERKLATVVVDGDLRRPRLATMLGTRVAPADPGFSNLLLGGAPLAMNEVALAVQGTFCLIPSGPLPPSPVVLLAQKGLADFERRARNLFDLILYDTPPLSFAADASLISAAAEATVLVIDARKTGRNAVLQAVEQLRRTNSKVLGIVVNRLAEDRRGSYYNSRYYRDAPDRTVKSNGSDPVIPAESPVRRAVRRRG